MGKEHQKAARLRDFASYSVTEKLCQEGGANPDWKFMHSLPRKGDEVDDEVSVGQVCLGIGVRVLWKDLDGFEPLLFLFSYPTMAMLVVWGFSRPFSVSVLVSRGIVYVALG